jgi:hypothetical protein
LRSAVLPLNSYLIEYAWHDARRDQTCCRNITTTELTVGVRGFALRQAIEASSDGNQRLRIVSFKVWHPMQHVVALNGGGKWKPQLVPTLIKLAGWLAPSRECNRLSLRKFLLPASRRDYRRLISRFVARRYANSRILSADRRANACDVSRRWQDGGGARSYRPRSDGWSTEVLRIGRRLLPAPCSCARFAAQCKRCAQGVPCNRLMRCHPRADNFSNSRWQTQDWDTPAAAAIR